MNNIPSNKLHLEKRKSLSQVNGITLTELIATVVITSVVVILAGSGIISMISANKKSEEDSTYLYEFNRSIEYIKNEIREARNVGNTAPATWSSLIGYSPILFIEKPFDISDTSNVNASSFGQYNTVGYYTKIPTVSEGWKSEKVIYRRFYNSGISTPPGEITPLLDGISIASVDCGTTTGTEYISGSNGFRVKVSSNRKKIQLCLQSTANDSGSSYRETATIAIRNN